MRAISIDPDDAEAFTFAHHDRYSGLNGFEREFAQALDKTQRVRFRNPPRGCFKVPLLTAGGSKLQSRLHRLDRGHAINTKGDHLIVEDAGRKLLSIDKVGSGPDLVIRLVTQGTWSDRFEKENRHGFTAWAIKNGKPHPLSRG